MRKLIITTGHGYSSKELRTFLISASVHIPEADVIIFSDNSTHKFLRQIESYNPKAQVIVPSDTSIRKKLWKLRWGKRSLGIVLDIIRKQFSRNPSTVPLKNNKTAMLHVSVARYIWTLAFLEECKSDPDMVLLTDSRDVFFQGDPFEDFQGSLVCGEEPISIQDCPVNSSWIEHVYSKKLVERVSTMPVLCSGVTLGKTQALRSYLNSMVSEIVENKIRLIYSSGLDQGIHNKILHDDKTLSFFASKNGDALLATLNYSKLNEFHPDTSEGLKTQTGKLVKIVHQYDRHAILSNWCSSLYG